jgi:hypothetical protein
MACGPRRFITAEKALARTPSGTGRPGPASGIDYLATLDAQRHRHLLHRPRLADPGARLHTAPSWHLPNIITGGQLVSPAASD